MSEFMKLSSAKITVQLILLLVSFNAIAAEFFNAEERVKSPAKIPASIVSYLTKEGGTDKIAACREIKPNERFEAEIININKATKAYVVKPAHMCLCESGHCPMWMFKLKGSTAKLIWSAPEVKVVEVLDKKLNGYRELKAIVDTATRGSEFIWSWDRDSYSEIYKNVWTFDTEKNCRFGEETTQLMDGRMVQHNIKCFSNP
jgi:hypothetical protein